MNDDSQLIDEALAGHSAAFGQLVQKYQDRLFNTMVHVTGHAEDARDVVQEAFVQAFLKLDTFKGASAFYTWLYRIAFNMAATRRRQARPTRSIELDRELGGTEPPDEGESPDDFALRRERQNQVHQALKRLSEEYRMVLVLREIDGCCYETIAEILDMPMGTVRSRLHRGRSQLREELREVLMSDEP